MTEDETPHDFPGLNGTQIHADHPAGRDGTHPQITQISQIPELDLNLRNLRNLRIGCLVHP
jgi:hypothetical protein